MAYNQYSLPSGSYENDQLFKTDNIYLILRYIAAMYSGSEYELRYLAPFRSTDKFTIGQLSPSSSWSGSAEHNLSSSILFRLLGPSGSGVIHRQLTVGNYMLDPTASLRVDGLVRITGGAPFSGALLSSVSPDGLAEWISPSILTTNGSGSSGTTSPAIPTNSVQYNNNNTFGGSSFFTYNSSSHHLNISGAISSSYGANTVGFFGTSSWAVSSSKSISSSYADTSSYVNILRASDPTQSIQFNVSGLLTGSSRFTINHNTHTIFATESIQILGNEKIQITGSEAGLQILGSYTSQSVLSNIPFIISTDRQSTVVYVPSGSTYGQIWYLHRPFVTYYGAAHVYDITSSVGNLRYRGTIGSSASIGRLQGHGVYRADISRLIALGSDPNSSGETLLAYNPNTIGSQPLNFTASFNGAYELSLIDYSCSMQDTHGGIISKVYSPGYAYNNNPLINISCATGDFTVVFGYATSSAGSSTPPLLFNTDLSTSINNLSASNLPLYDAAPNYPIGVFLTSCDSNTPSQTQYIDITTDLIDLAIPYNKIFSGSFNGSTLSCSSNRSWLGSYNATTSRLYCLIDLINNNNLNAIIEYDCASWPPIPVSVYTSSAALTQFGSIVVEEETQTVIVRESGQLKIYDARVTVDWANPLQTITLPLSYRNILGYSSSYYVTNYTFPAGGSGTGPNSVLIVNRLSESIGLFTHLSNSIQSYFTGSNSSYGNMTSPAYASSINKIFTADRSNIANSNNTDTSLISEDRINTFARAEIIYVIDTSSLAINVAHTPYSTSLSNGPNHLVEFRQQNTQMLSYVDENGVFIGTASLSATSSLPLLGYVSASINGSVLTLFRGNTTTSSLYLSSSGTSSATIPGGNDRSIQFNNSSAFNGANNFRFSTSSTSSLSFTGSFELSGSLNSQNIFGSNASIYNIGATQILSVGFTGSLLGTASYALQASNSLFANTASYVDDASIVRRLSNGAAYQFATWGTSDKIQPLVNMISDDSSLQINLLTGLYTPDAPYNILTIDAGTAGDMNYGLDLTGSLYITGSSQITGSLYITGSARVIGSLIVTGSSEFTGSVNVIGSNQITGSLIQTGSVILSGTFSHQINLSQPPFVSEFFEDFLAPFVATSNTNILVAVSGGASATVTYQAPSIDCTTGQIRCTTGTTTLGRAQIYTQNTILTFGWDTPWIWSARCKVSQSSNGTNNFTCSIGYGDSITGPNHVDWLGFYYNHNANSDAWSFRSQKAGVMTSSSITYPFTASQYHVFRILVNAAGTTASGYIDDTWMGFITSSIPTSSATFGAFNIGLQKNGGTTARVLDIDYIYAKAFPPSRSQYLSGQIPI